MLHSCVPLSPNHPASTYASLPISSYHFGTCFKSLLCFSDLLFVWSLFYRFIMLTGNMAAGTHTWQMQLLIWRVKYWSRINKIIALAASLLDSQPKLRHHTVVHHCVPAPQFLESRLQYVYHSMCGPKIAFSALDRKSPPRPFSMHITSGSKGCKQALINSEWRKFSYQRPTAFIRWSRTAAEASIRLLNFCLAFQVIFSY